MRPSDGRMSLWPAAVIVFIAVVSVSLITPTVRLKAEPPSDFVVLRASDKAPNARIAKEYWDVAVDVIQWKYPRTSNLPEQAPADFRPIGDTGTAARSEERAAYWQKLREDWLKADNWSTSYSVDFGLPFRELSMMARAAMSFLGNHDPI